MQVVIVDDEQGAIALLKELLLDLPEFEVVASFTDPKLAMDYILKVNRVELLFLDVDMPKISGVELAGVMRKHIEKLVFTTAHSQYAYEAFELQADGFLRKPFGLAKLQTVLRKLYPVNEQERLQSSVEGMLVDDFIFVKVKEDSKLLKVNLRDISVIESKNNYVELLMGDKNVMTKLTLNELAKKLNGQPDFIQVQRSFIINKNYIEYIDGNTLKMVGGERISIGNLYRDQFNVFVEERMFRERKR